MKDPKREEPADAVLVARVQQRDTAAFTTLYDRYERCVYVLAAHTLGLADAEEVVQDVFVRLWRKADQYDPARGSFNSWLMAIAHNRVIDVLRRRGNGFPSADEIEAVLEAAEDPALDPAEEALLSVRSRLVLKALRELPLEQRRVLVLAYFGGLSQSSIAETLGWPLGTVKKRVRLGLRKLQLSLENELAPEAREAQGGTR